MQDSVHGPRFDRQVRFAPLGSAGQERIEKARVLLVGCGALGGVLAQNLYRAGVGTLLLVDRDVVEYSNLPRQVLFDEEHARSATPKVIASSQTLQRAGGPTQVCAHAVHLDADNLPQLAEGCDLILDGTDNLNTRYLINDYCVRTGTPWIYGGVVGGSGMVLPVLPGSGPCLRCLFREPPPAGSLPTCDTAGVIAPAVGLVASMQAGLALRILCSPESLEPGLLELDVWNGQVRRLGARPDPDCPACAQGEHPWLDEPAAVRAVSLCGRNTVQVRGQSGGIDLDELAGKLEGVAQSIQRAGPLLRFRAQEFTFSVFPDGRTLVEGTEDTGRALALVDRYLGQ